MAKVKTHTLNGRTYYIRIGATEGMCTTFKLERELHVFCDPSTRKGLITTIHESLHACNWAKKEAVVDQVSIDIGRLLWRLGWRKQNDNT